MKERNFSNGTPQSLGTYPLKEDTPL